MALLLLGIGQSLNHDDGAGPAAVRLWQETHPHAAQNPSLRVEITELPGLGLLNLLEGFQAAILVDAVQSGAEPGTIHLLVENDLAAFSPGSGSAHGWGVAETLALGRKLGLEALPSSLTLIGIEGLDFSPGVGLSKKVEECLPQVCSSINTLVTSYAKNRTGEKE